MTTATPRAFISYVSEDSTLVDQLQRDLEAAGIQVWRDKDQLAPGMQWKTAIRRAIRNGTFFLACFSKASASRTKSYMFEELTIAIDELRQRSQDSSWFLPLKLNDCDIPDWDIGGGRNLRDIQYAELYQDWPHELQRIVDVLLANP